MADEAPPRSSPNDYWGRRVLSALLFGFTFLGAVWFVFWDTSRPIADRAQVALIAISLSFIACLFGGVGLVLLSHRLERLLAAAFSASWLMLIAFWLGDVTAETDILREFIYLTPPVLVLLAVPLAYSTRIKRTLPPSTWWIWSAAAWTFIMWIWSDTAVAPTSFLGSISSVGIVVFVLVIKLNDHFVEWPSRAGHHFRFVTAHVGALAIMAIAIASSGPIVSWRYQQIARTQDLCLVGPLFNGPRNCMVPDKDQPGVFTRWSTQGLLLHSSTGKQPKQLSCLEPRSTVRVVAPDWWLVSSPRTFSRRQC